MEGRGWDGRCLWVGRGLREGNEGGGRCKAGGGEGFRGKGLE